MQVNIIQIRPDPVNAAGTLQLFLKFFSCFQTGVCCIYVYTFKVPIAQSTLTANPTSLPVAVEYRSRNERTMVERTDVHTLCIPMYIIQCGGETYGAV